MKKRVPYAIIPKYLKTTNGLDNRVDIKGIYGKLKFEETPHSEPAKFKLSILIEQRLNRQLILNH